MAVNVVKLTIEQKLSRCVALEFYGYVIHNVRHYNSQMFFNQFNEISNV